MRPSIQELMDRSPSEEMLRAVDAAAHAVEGVLATEKLKARKSGTRFLLGCTCRPSHHTASGGAYPQRQGEAGHLGVGRPMKSRWSLRSSAR